MAAPPGPGARNVNPYQQGAVHITGLFDDDTRNFFTTLESERGEAVFPGAGRGHMFDVRDFEIAYMSVNNRRAHGESPDPKVLTALNGLGDDELMNIKLLGDADLLKEAIEARIVIVGSATRDYDSTTGKKNQDFALQIRGMKKYYSFGDTPFGCLLRACVPTPREAEKLTQMQIPGNEVGKTTLIYKRVDPQDIIQKVATHSRNSLINRAVYLKVMGDNVTKTTLSRAVNSLHTAANVQAILAIAEYVKRGAFSLTVNANSPLNIVDQNEFGGNPNLTLNKEMTINYLAGLAAKMGLLDFSHYQNIDGITYGDSSRIRALRGEVTRAMFWDFAFGENAFGFNNETREIPGIDADSGTIRDGTAFGSLIKKASTSWQISAASLYEFCLQEASFIMGRNYKSATDGAMGQYFLNR